MSTHRSIGNLLLDSSIITEEQLQKALAEQSISGKRLGDILVELGFATEEQVVGILSEQMGLAYVDLHHYEIEEDVLSLIDEKTAHRFQAIPIFRVENTLTVVMADPLDIQSVDQLNGITGLEIQPVFGTKGAIRDFLNRHYRGSDLKDAVEAYRENNREPSVSSSSRERVVDISTADGADNAPAVKFLNLLLAEAVRDGASDIHFEPGEKSFDIRIRIDGVLHPLTPPPKSLQGAIISRLKVLANLDIAEKRLPQDGRVQISLESKLVDLRVSTFPTIFGENIVIRLLDKSQGILSIENLGIAPEMLESIRELIESPNGIVLVTGPTGSGKTTTLYSFLSEINRADRNIMTLEDPVEYQIAGIRQAHVDIKAGLTFGVGLRSILRQDPDVIMIGEIRDLETAQIAIQSALTGHLVFSTLHTNDAPSTVTRMVDMGIEPYLISSSLTAIIAQRLLRKLCESCKKPYRPGAGLLKRLGLPEKDYTFYEEKGCPQCRDTGFRGRIGIYELFVPSREIKQMINDKSSAVALNRAAVSEGFVDLKHDGIEKVVMGVSSITELLRVI